MGIGQQLGRSRGAACRSFLSLIVLCAACSGTATEASPTLRSETTAVSDIATTRGSGDGQNLTEFDREAFARHLAEDSPELPADAERFFGEAQDDQIDEFVAETCRQLRPDLPIDDNSAAVSAVWQSLGPEQQALLSFDEVASAMTVASQFFCPDRLPESGALLSHNGAAGDLGGFRQLVSAEYEPEAPVRLFVESLSDDRLGELQQQACLLSADDEDLVDFGETAFNHYADQLLPVERTTLELADYVEVFIAFIDWFCPDRLNPRA